MPFNLHHSSTKSAHSPVSPLDCSTKDQSPQTFYGNAGPSKYLVKAYKGALHGAFLIPSDSKDAQRGSTVLVDAAIAGGVKADQTKLMSGRDPQSAYTPIVNQMKADGSKVADQVVTVEVFEKLGRTAVAEGRLRSEV